MSNGKAKPEIIAFAPVDWDNQGGRRSLVNGDMRLIVSPMRYKVQRYQVNHSFGRVHGFTFGWEIIQSFPRTRRTYIEQEFECATRMFERRVRERNDALTFRMWPQLTKMKDDHLVNIVKKIIRENWRRQGLSHIIAELKHRGIDIEEVKHGKTA